MDLPKQHSRLKVVLLSLPARTQAVLEFFFNSTGRGSFVAMEEAEAEAAVFDLDTLESREHWEAFHARTGRPGIALSVQPQTAIGAVWVQKPITPAALLAAAADLRNGRWVRPEGEPETAAESPAKAAPLDATKLQAPASEDATGPVQAAGPASAAAPAEAAPGAATATSAAPASTPAQAVAPDPAAVAGPAPAPARTAAPVPPQPKPERAGGGFGGLLRRFLATGKWSGTAAQGDAPPVSGPNLAAPAAAPQAPVADAPPPAAAAAPAAVMVRVVHTAGDSDAPATVADAASEPVPLASSAAPAAAAPEAPAPQPVARARAPVAHEHLIGGSAAAALANEAQLCGLLDDLPAERMASDPSLRYDPEQQLVSALGEAYRIGYKWQVPTHVDCNSGRIVVDAPRNLLMADLSLEALDQEFAVVLDKRPKTRTLNRHEQSEMLMARPLDGEGTGRLDDVIWRAGMLTAAGRLPVNLDPQAVIYLRHWPNLTRLSAIPHAMRIAALWSVRGASLIETSELLGIPQRHVLAFYNGALALDLITGDGGHVRRAQRKTGRNRSVLVRLLGWLGR